MIIISLFVPSWPKQSATGSAWNTTALILSTTTPSSCPAAGPQDQRSLLRVLAGTHGAHRREVADEVRLLVPQSMALSREADDEALTPPLAAAPKQGHHHR